MERNAEALHVFARAGLAADADLEAPALLLEGSWPRGAAPASLDDCLDARHAWIDEAAESIGRQIAGQQQPAVGIPPVTIAWLNLLPLRYWLIKMIRVAAWFEELAPTNIALVVWHLQAGRDDDYARLAVQLGAKHGHRIQFAWRPDDAITSGRGVFPPNERWRRLAARWCGDRRWRACRDEPRPRVVLSGNPRILDPVCDELLSRGARVWWLYDRFAAGSWLQWRPRGARQLVCNSSVGRSNDLPLSADLTVDPPTWRGLDLTPLVDAWLQRQTTSHGPRQSRLAAQTQAHFARVRPTHVIVDEDATPLPRTAIAAAGRCGATSAVVQNAAPGVPFGFTSLVADRLFCWGASSRRRFEAWGIAGERLVETGSPWHDWLRRRIRARRRSVATGRRVLLLTTPPPRDERPDLVGYAKTTRRYQAMAAWCFRAVSELAGARLTVKLHPRATTSEPFAALIRAHAGLPSLLTSLGRLEDLFAETDLVISLGSSAGVEAALAGLPVVQVLPSGSADLLPAEDWGLVGTARSLDMLRRLLGEALGRTQPVLPNSQVFGDDLRSAASRIAESVFADLHGASDGSRGAASRPHARRTPAHHVEQHAHGR